MRPLVSICIPCRNGRDYLDERMSSIFAQTLGDWEIVVVDDDSSDGSREVFEEAARRDSRVRLFSGPGRGLYPGWNQALRHARGDFIYYAPCDDTIPPDFLSEMLAALNCHPECGIAHAPLRVIGLDAERIQRWWETQSLFALSVGGAWNRSHIRRYPLDGWLATIGSVYISMTQLVIRREVFAAVGDFEELDRPYSDALWTARAGFLENVVHVPSVWGGWRRHEEQVTPIGGNPYAEELRALRGELIAANSACSPSPYDESYAARFGRTILGSDSDSGRWARSKQKLRRWGRRISSRPSSVAKPPASLQDDMVSWLVGEHDLITWLHEEPQGK